MEKLMPHKDPGNYPLLTYLWVLALSVWGGAVNNLRKLKDGTLKRFSLAELVGDFTISGFIGVMTFYLCEYAGFDKLLTAFLVGITSHMGTKGLSVLEDLAVKKLGIVIEEDKKDK
jgi:hypothetical protein